MKFAMKFYENETLEVGHRNAFANAKIQCKESVYSRLPSVVMNLRSLSRWCVYNTSEPAQQRPGVPTLTISASGEI